MSIRVPDDTLSVIENLLDSAKRALPDMPLHLKLLTTGAVIDAENLIAEIKADMKSSRLTVPEFTDYVSNFYACDECKNASNVPEGISHSATCSKGGKK